MNWKRSSCLEISAAWALASIAGAQVTTPEVEPNDNKGQAQLVVMSCGDIITGTTTGTSTTVAGAASADYFLIRTTATGGLNKYPLQTTPAAATGAPANSKINRWYGHGPAGANQDIYVRVTGSSTTTNPYFLTLTCAPVSPTAIAGTLLSNTNVKVAPDAATDTAMDSDFWVYDSTLTPIATYGHDDADITGVTRPCAPGT